MENKNDKPLTFKTDADTISSLDAVGRVEDLTISQLLRKATANLLAAYTGKRILHGFTAAEKATLLRAAKRAK